MAKRILHISKYYYPFHGGTEQIARECAVALKDRCEQRIICFNHEQGDRTDYVDGIEIIRAGCFAKMSSQSLSLSFGGLLKVVLRDFAPDMIIFHYPNPFAAHYLLRQIGANAKLVIYWHLDIVKQVVLRKLFWLQNRRLVIRADRILATSPDYVEGSYWLSRAKEKCRVVPNGIDADRFQRDDGTLMREAEIRKENEGKIVCLAVGRHTKYKGFTYLIQASRYLDDRFRFYLIGEGELTDRLKKQAEGDSKIRFLGRAADAELRAYMNAMDIFCFPSITRNEAFGLALAEAMYCGKPAVTFTIRGSGVNYVSLNGITGIEVPNRDVKAYADALRRLADAPGLRERYGKAARRRVEENFLAEALAENIRKEIGVPDMAISGEEGA